jgi:ferritin-like metal-binding protein YciE
MATNRNAHDSGAADQVRESITGVSGQIRGLIDQHRANVKAMRADASMTRVMDEYDGVEARFDKAAQEVENIIKLLTKTLEEFNVIAGNAEQQALKAVGGMGG